VEGINLQGGRAAIGAVVAAAGAQSENRESSAKQGDLACDSRRLWRIAYVLGSRLGCIDRYLQ